MSLTKESFLALAAIGWADGALQKVETVGLLRAAKEAGLPENELFVVEMSTKQKMFLEDIDLAGLTPWGQVFTYALASWLAALDGVVSTDEHETMKKLGDLLGLPEMARKKAAAAAFDIAVLPEGGRPERYDFQKLAARLKEKLPGYAD
jgi:hypothetical protein